MNEQFPNTNSIETTNIEGFPSIQSFLAIRKEELYPDSEDKQATVALFQLAISHSPTEQNENVESFLSNNTNLEEAVNAFVDLNLSDDEYQLLSNLSENNEKFAVFRSYVMANVTSENKETYISLSQKLSIFRQSFPLQLIGFCTMRLSIISASTIEQLVQNK